MAAVTVCSDFGAQENKNYLLDYWFIIKQCSSRTARWKTCMGQAWREGHRASMPSQSAPLTESLCVHQPKISLNLFPNYKMALPHLYDCQEA